MRLGPLGETDNRIASPLAAQLDSIVAASPSRPGMNNVSSAHQA
jgi:hypothetical protein